MKSSPRTPMCLAVLTAVVIGLASRPATAQFGGVIEKIAREVGKVADPTSSQSIGGQAFDEALGRTHLPIVFENRTSKPVTVVIKYAAKTSDANRFQGLSTRIRTIAPYSRKWVVNNYGNLFYWHAKVKRL